MPTPLTSNSTNHLATSASGIDPTQFESFAHLVRARAAHHPKRLAFTFISTGDSAPLEMSYQTLHAKASTLATHLLTVTDPGARALIVCRPGLDYIVAMIGCLYAGVIAVPVYPPTRHRPVDRLTSIVEDAQATVALTTSAVLDGFRDRLRAAKLSTLNWVCIDGLEQVSDHLAAEHSIQSLTPSSNETELAFLQYTSGSTGAPKGVEVTHASLLDNSMAIQEKFRTSEQDRFASWLPPYHDMGLIGSILQPLYAGIDCVLMAPGAFLERPARWLQAMTDYRITFSGAPNFAYQLCVDRITPADVAQIDLSRLRCAFVGAEPVRAETLQAFADKFLTRGFNPHAFLPCYGLAEATLFVSGIDPDKSWTSSELAVDGKVREFVGHGGGAGFRPIIVSPSQRTVVMDGQEGEIWVDAKRAARGYWQKPEETEYTFRAYLADTNDGPYLRTGDLGFVQNDELYITGRIKDLIVVRGRNLYPQDIEYVVERAHADLQVGASAAFSMPGESTEQIGLVCEVRRQSLRRLDTAAVETAIRKAVSQYFQVSIAQIFLIKPARLARTTSGKVQRQASRQAAIDGSLECLNRLVDVRGAAEVASTEIRGNDDRIAEVVAVVAGALKIPLDQVALDVPVSELGLDSLDAVNIKFEIEQRVGIVIPVDAFFDDTSLRQLVSSGDAPPTVTKIALTDSAGDDTAAGTPKQSSAIDEKVHARESADMQMSLMYFSSDATQTSDRSTDGNENCYDLVIQGSEVADELGFHAVWLPERHFHPFGGLYPSPAVLASAVSVRTHQLRIRAGSVVLPMADPIRVAEEWAVIDNLSNGRVDLAIAAGWNPNDFVLAPNDYEQRVDRLYEGMNTVKALWRGESVARPNGVGKTTDIQIYPKPIQSELNLWITCSGGAERFAQAGEIGANVLTALLFQDTDELAEKISAYRRARAKNGFDPDAGQVTLMLHTYMGNDADQVKQTVRGPFLTYLESSVDLWRQGATRLDELSDAERTQVLDFAFERYYRTSGLFGTPEQCQPRLDALRSIGVNEIACLVDFGIGKNDVLASLSQIARLIPTASVTRSEAEVPTYAKAAKRLESLAGSQIPASQAPRLDPSVTFVSQAQRASTERGRSILLTGATGFLGAHLLAGYLNDGQTRMHCLVRAADMKQAVQRIKSNLIQHGLWQPGMQDRIEAIPADLATPWLGLAPERFEHLALNVDAIVHAACQVNLLASYEQLAPVNVGGTEALLRLAANGHATAFHYVSTCGVFSEGFDPVEVVDESNAPRAQARWSVPLAQTKWEAEQLVWQASERGLVVKIYRPGTLTASTTHSVSPRSSYLSALIDTCIELGVVPDSSDKIQICPVDFVSDAIVKLSGQAVPSNSVYHLINRDSPAIRDLPQLLGPLGFELTLQDQETGANCWEMLLPTTVARVFGHSQASYLTKAPTNPCFVLPGRA